MWASYLAKDKLTFPILLALPAPVLALLVYRSTPSSKSFLQMSVTKPKRKLLLFNLACDSLAHFLREIVSSPGIWIRHLYMASHSSDFSTQIPFCCFTKICSSSSVRLQVAKFPKDWSYIIFLYCALSSLIHKSSTPNKCQHSRAKHLSRILNSLFVLLGEYCV